MVRLGTLRNERGTTLVELLVAMAAGTIVMATLATVIMITIHGTARVDARVEATQRARIGMTRIIEQLHNACIAPKATPILEGSSGTTLKFIHAVGSQTTQVAPVPTKTEIKYSEGILKQYDYAGTGNYPNTTYSSTATISTILTSVGPIAPSSSIFKYFGSANDAATEVVPGSSGLTSAQAVGVIEVNVGLNASPSSTPVSDAGSATAIQDGAILRLTPPSFNEKATAPPCQ